MHVAFLNLHNHKILLILILYRLNSEDKLLELIRLHLLFSYQMFKDFKRIVVSRGCVRSERWSPFIKVWLKLRV